MTGDRAAALAIVANIVARALARPNATTPPPFAKGGAADWVSEAGPPDRMIASAAKSRSLSSAIV